MASSCSVLATLTIAATLLLLLAPQAHALVNLYEILSRGGQYTQLTRLLNQTQVGTQIQNQLNNSNDGLTVFAPTDNAFSNLKAGTLNSLSQQDQVALILYHVLPKFYTFANFQTASNPVRTQATGQNGGQYDLNVTASGSNSQQFTLSTGINNTVVNNALNVTFPLAVYSLDAVLLPADLFGTKARAGSPAPAGEVPKNGSGGTTPAAAGGPAGAATPAGSGVARGSVLGWWSVVGVGLVGAFALL